MAATLKEALMTVFLMFFTVCGKYLAEDHHKRETGVNFPSDVSPYLAVPGSKAEKFEHCECVKAICVVHLGVHAHRAVLCQKPVRVVGLPCCTRWQVSLGHLKLLAILGGHLVEFQPQVKATLIMLSLHHGDTVHIGIIIVERKGPVLFQLSLSNARADAFSGNKLDVNYNLSNIEFSLVVPSTL